MSSETLCLWLALWGFIILQCSHRRKGCKLPPGPRGLPVLGVTLELLDFSVKPWTRFTRWSRQYDHTHQGMISVPTLFRTNIVIEQVILC